MAEEQKQEESTLALPQPLSLDDFDLGVTLGTGSFGRVRFITHKATGSYWALKMLKKELVVRLQQVEHIMSEKNILSKLAHPFIVRFAGGFQDPKYLYMVLEYIIGGEFFSHLRRTGRFDNSASCFYSAQIVCVFEYLHSLDVIYRDLKPENLLLDQTGHFKITDFGFAKKVAFKTYTLCGTPEYIAPEVLLNKGHGKGVDWWTLGILMFEMLSGQPPFVDNDPMGIYQKILAGKITWPRYFERNAKSLIKKLLVDDLTKRLGCLKGGAQDIKKHKFFNGMDWAALLERRLPAPIVPRVNGATDTSNFDPYPDSTEETRLPVYNGEDPFTTF
uniref:cAMP-dependent protein kinase n=1 Tax=Heterosigma akashiwo TaxID=2829 RepID=A0A6S9HA20_HETAK|mmetsp:Transcript_19171/g.28976  ORF Transcript_19171/g.28976 Transcript_19171/m.28976 type:complete len:332 (-) Transcript_19171:381-1376(-)|eukprot:CAMPEP_0194585048 /NCGR_PEP_ID=MMETSP0292-20121207/17485_1 /TAXON_ID=39354 /ORGANISM="Heterosigma akashiwo, Strain CCMP2393" /LENGTH=331 /DNA_ID=CAMNT_0039440351 /DNA_START=135 /DNA_END=1130 /DNA_ORIENTATION=-